MLCLQVVSTVAAFPLASVRKCLSYVTKTKMVLATMTQLLMQSYNQPVTDVSQLLLLKCSTLLGAVHAAAHAQKDEQRVKGWL